MTLTVGVIGGGQLARMMLPPAVALGVRVRVLAETADGSATIAPHEVGDYLDVETVLRFASGVDVVTFDHEHVPQPVLARLVAAGVPVRPGPHALEFAQDKLRMRERVSELGLPSPAWARVTDERGLQEFLDAHGGAGVLKTARGGYDGRGVRVVRSAADAVDWFAALSEDGNPGALLVEELVDFRRELAQQVARRPSGEIAAYPLVETVQRGGVCAEVVAPAPGTTADEEARAIAETIARELDVTGMLAVELFETRDGRVLVNELAMRPHNSGHWSIEGAVTSQFEQHLRAVLDLPLGSTRAREPVTVMVNILGGPTTGTLDERYPAALSAPDVKLHLYGKEPRPGRKIGHATAWGADREEVAARARAVTDSFR